MRRILRAATGGLLASLVLIAGFAALWPMPEAARLRPSDVIVVLGGGMGPDGRLHRSSSLRVDRGVALWRAGLAPRLHFTGGSVRPGGPSAAERMAERARAAGVPADAITIETNSHSTLQNALFSRPALRSAQSLRLVTEGFHLPRAWASFQVFGPYRLHLSHSERFRGPAAEAPGSALWMLLREALAWWFNLARLAVFALAGLWGGADPDWLA